MKRELTGPASHALGRRRFAAIAFGAGAFVLAACESLGTGSGTNSSWLGALPKRVADLAPRPSPSYLFEAYNDGTGNTEITSINNDTNKTRIEGVAYGTGSNNLYHSFIATESATGSITFGTPVPEPPNSPPDVYLAAISDNPDSNMNSNSGSVGFSPPISGSGCTGDICGLIYAPNATTSKMVLSQVQDPNEGSGTCSKTYLYGTSDPNVQVGYYYTKKNGSCVAQAFEEYLYPSGPQFVDFSPPAFGSTTGCQAAGTGAYSSMAYGINNKGDVVGTMTTTASGPVTGWEYRDFCYLPIHVNSDPTQALGIDWQDTVVGFYQDSSKSMHGLVCAGPNTCWTEDDGPNGTVINDINDDSTIVGWHLTSYGSPPILKGFIATCSQCP